MNFFKLYIGDYQRDTGTLTLAEHGAYMLMLQHYYATEHPLPSGRELHRLLRAETPAERKSIDAVVDRFWSTTEAGLVNVRADEEITKGRAQAITNRAIAVAREARKRGTTPARDEHESCTTREPNHSHSQGRDKSLPVKRAGRLPDGWQPGPEGEQYALKTGMVNGRMSAEVEKFRDWWAAAPGQRGVKADWSATWRTWVRNAVEKQGTKPETGGIFDGAT